MSRFGKYNPSEAGNSSALFSYGETPLASSKLNLWNGNIEAALGWLTECAAVLFGGGENDFILGEGTGDELRVTAFEFPCLRVQALPGKALVSRYFAGLDEVQALPAAGSFEAPIANPRWDVVCLDVYGAVSVVQGQEAASPVVPDTPEDSLALGRVYLRPSMTCILDSDDGVNGYIEDCRPALLCGRANRWNEDPSPVESADGSRTQFSTAMQYVSGSLDVFVNGLLQAKSGVYAEDSERRSYTFLQAPPEGYAIQHRYRVQSE